MRAMRLLAPGGVLFTASCSFHLTLPLFMEMLRVRGGGQWTRMVLARNDWAAADHPEVLTIPETGYLKGALLEASD